MFMCSIDIPWASMGIAAVQTFVIFWVTIFILKIFSARVFSQTSPEYLLFLLLLASGMYSGIAGNEPTIWKSIATGITLLVSVLLINKVPYLQRFITGKPIVLVKDGQINDKEMKRTMVDVEDLNTMAREYGFRSFKAFDTIILEKNGHLTGVINFDNNSKVKLGKK